MINAVLGLGVLRGCKCHIDDMHIATVPARLIDSSSVLFSRATWISELTCYTLQRNSLIHQ